MDILKNKLFNLRLNKPDIKISFVSGNFNVIHAGHIRLLRFAKEIADILIVGVNPKNDSNFRFKDIERLNSVKALNMIDYSFIINSSIEETLEMLRPDFVVKGKEHEYLNNIEKHVLDLIGGKLIFSSGFTRPSEEDIEYLASDSFNLHINIPKDYSLRHSINNTVLNASIKNFKNLKICVIGDLIIDEYINCDPLGMSQEDPTLVVSPTSIKRYLGGAGIVAAHASRLGAQVSLFSVCGQDSIAEFAKEKLNDFLVNPFFAIDSERPTTLKQRFRCLGKTLLRVSYLRSYSINQELASDIILNIKKYLNKTDLCIFSDFNYGCLPQFLVDEVIKLMVSKNIPIVADSQSSSQIGDISRFHNTLLLTPTEREARLAVHDFESGLVVLANKLMNKTNSNHIVLTLGKTGALINTQNGMNTDQIPALNLNCKDTSGAGDSLYTVTAMALATGTDIWHATYLGSLAAAVQVSREGNIPITNEDLINLLNY